MSKVLKKRLQVVVRQADVQAALDRLKVPYRANVDVSMLGQSQKVDLLITQESLDAFNEMGAAQLEVRIGNGIGINFANAVEVVTDDYNLTAMRFIENNLGGLSQLGGMVGQLEATNPALVYAGAVEQGQVHVHLGGFTEEQQGGAGW